MFLKQGNVATFPRVHKKNNLSQRRNVLERCFATQLCDVPERCYFPFFFSSVTTFGSNVTTLRANFSKFLKSQTIFFEKINLSIEKSLIEGPYFSKSIVGFSIYVSVVASISEPKNTTNEQ